LRYWKFDTWHYQKEIVINGVVIGIIVVSAYFPLVLPFHISDLTREYYSFIHSIPPDSVVGFMMGETPVTRLQLRPATVLTMVKLWENGSGIVFWYDKPESGPILQDYIEDAENILNKELEKGVDFVNVGYIPGHETGLAAFLKDIRNFAGAPDSEAAEQKLPLLDGVKNGSDMEYGLINTACRGNSLFYIRQWQEPYNANIAVINCGSNRATQAPFLATGRIKGLASGLLASAKIEKLMGRPGNANRTITTVSLLGLYLVSLIIYVTASNLIKNRI
jgi:hypothetical protein